MSNKGWIGFDLDGTLAVYTHWQGPEHIGQPIPAMVQKVKELLAAGHTVKIFTARVCSAQSKEDLMIAYAAINAWCSEQFGHILEITAEKDYNLIEFYDDRAIPVEYNTGRIMLEEVV